MLNKLTDPKFFVPAFIVALAAVWVANNVAFVRNLVNQA